MPQAEVTVEADSLGIVLKYEGRPELRLAVIQNALDADVLDSFQNAELPLRSAR